MIKTTKFTLAIILLLIGGCFWFSGTTDIHSNDEADIELIKSEVSKYLGISLIDDDLFFVTRKNDFGTPFNHVAVDFIYLDAIINKPLLKEKLLIKFNESSPKTDENEDVFLTLALSVEDICKYTQRVNMANSTFCDNDSLEHRHLTISNSDDFGHVIIFYDIAQNKALLRRFWALDSDF